MLSLRCVERLWGHEEMRSLEGDERLWSHEGMLSLGDGDGGL